MPVPSSWLRLLKDERVVVHNLIVATGTVSAGVLGVAFQALVSHRFQPADYGAVFAVVSLITLIALPAGAFTLLMARETSRDLASGQRVLSAALLRRGNRTLVLVGVALAAVLVLVSPVLSQFLDVQVALLLAAAIGIPFMLALPLLLGEFQGEQRFLTLSMLLVGQAALKLVAAIGLGSVWGAVGVIAGISVASAAIYFVALRLLQHRMAVKSRLPWLRPAASYLTVVVPSTLALGVLLSTDVLLVKHYFSSQTAGEYAAVAALGRAIFWGASGVAAVLFPKVVFRTTQGRSGSHLVAASLLLVASGGAAGLGILAFGSRWLLLAFAGRAYVGAAGYLPLYAIGMILLGIAAVLIATHQTRGKTGFLAILLPLTLLEPALLIAFHQSIIQVVELVDLSMALAVVGLGTLYVVEQRRHSLIPIEMATDDPMAPQIAASGGHP